MSSLNGIENFPQLVQLHLFDSDMAELSFDEAPNLHWVRVSDSSIGRFSPSCSKMESLKILDSNVNETDLEACHGLEYLSISRTTGIDDLLLPERSNLAELNMFQSPIEHIVIPQSDSIKSIFIRDSELHSIELHESDSLAELDLSGNQLPGIEVPRYPRLSTLNLSNNILESFDISNVPGLSTLDVSHNNLRHLDVSNFPILSGVFANDNQLTDVTLAANDLFGFLVLDNNHISHLELPDLGENLVISIHQNPITCSSLDELLARYHVLNAENLDCVKP